MNLIYWLEDEDPKLHRAVMGVRDAVQEIWKAPVHRHYTDHSLQHSARVIENLNALTEALMTNEHERLSPSEAYILLAAAYLHDVGMQDERYTANMDPMDAMTWIREHHHELTRDMILSHLEQRNDFVDLVVRHD